MQTVIEDLLAKRRDRVIAIILNTKERDVDKYLPPEVRAKLRKVILDQLNDFHELTLDVLRSLDTGEVVLNELYMEKIDEIHDRLVKNGAR